MKNNSSSINNEKLTLKEVIAMGIGGMVGGGIFSVLGLAIAQAGHAAPFAFTLGGCIALLTGLSYARLGLVFQSSGGSELLIVTIKVIILFLFAGIGLFYVRADHLLPVFINCCISIRML